MWDDWVYRYNVRPYISYFDILAAILDATLNIASSLMAAMRRQSNSSTRRSGDLKTPKTISIYRKTRFDEKSLFSCRTITIVVHKQCQNDVVDGHKKKEIPVGRLYHETSRFSKKVMISAGVSMRGKTRINFIDTSKTKVNAECYIKLLDDNLLPDCRE